MVIKMHDIESNFQMKFEYVNTISISCCVRRASLDKIDKNRFGLNLE